MTHSGGGGLSDCSHHINLYDLHFFLNQQNWPPIFLYLYAYFWSEPKIT